MLAKAAGAKPAGQMKDEKLQRRCGVKHNDEVKLLAKFKELVVLLMSVMDQLAAHSRRNHTLRPAKVGGDQTMGR